MNICNNANSVIIFQTIFGFIKLITIAVPILVIIVGMLDFYKTVTGNDPDIPKTMKIFSKRLFTAVLVFLVIPIVTFTFNIFVPNNNITECINIIQNNASINNEVDEEPAVISDDLIEENKEKCEQNNRVYIKRLTYLIPIELKTTEYYLESGDYSYICTDGEVE